MKILFFRFTVAGLSIREISASATVLVGLFFFVACGKEKVVQLHPAEIASHRQMLSKLAEVEKQTEVDNYYLSYVGIEQLEQGIADDPEVRNDPAALAELQLELGMRKLRYGLERESIEHFIKLQKAAGQRGNTGMQIDVGFHLALAWLRLAETENCCAKPGPDSCIFPLKGGAIHEAREGSENALKILSGLVDQPSLDEDNRARVLWLLNIAHMTLGESAPELPEEWRLPDPESAAPDGDFPRFKNIAQAAGVDTFSLSGGAIADDFDGDGRFDLVVSSWDPSVSMKFFRNRGNGTFEDLSERANFEGIKGGLNLKQVDFDNDGDLDVYVMRGAWMQ